MIEKYIIKTNISRFPPTPGKLGGLMLRNDRLIIFIGIIVIAIALVGAAFGGSPKIDEDHDDDVVDYWDWPIKESAKSHISRTSSENTEYPLTFNISDMYVTQITFELHWLDEDPDTMFYENQPDTFRFMVNTPWGDNISSLEVANEIGSPGLIIETIEVPEEGIKDGATGQWEVIIFCGNCGDQIFERGLGIYSIDDTGNAWTLTHYYELYSNR